MKSEIFIPCEWEMDINWPNSPNSPAQKTIYGNVQSCKIWLVSSTNKRSKAMAPIQLWQLHVSVNLLSELRISVLCPTNNQNNRWTDNRISPWHWWHVSVVLHSHSSVPQLHGVCLKSHVTFNSTITMAEKWSEQRDRQTGKWTVIVQHACLF